MVAPVEMTVATHDETLIEHEAAAIERIKQARAMLGDEVVILGHHYQRDEVVQFADFQGDSYQLCQEGAKVKAKYIVFAGVHFMAESAAILGRADQVVILPNLQAGCSMADMANLEQVLTAWDELEQVLMDDPATRVMPITYMNSAANLKAFVGARGGTVCTSSNARGALDWAFAQREKVFFFPDQHLGRNTGRAMGIPLDQMVLWNPYKPFGGLTDEQIKNARIILWQGHCSVHQQFRLDHVDLWRKHHPDINIIVHPECALEVVDKADYVGSTAYIIKTIEAAPAGSKWAIGTEVHLVNRLKEAHPDKLIQLLSPFACLCSTMYRISPLDLANVLENLVEGRLINPITVPEEVARNARLALDRMLAIPPMSDVRTNTLIIGCGIAGATAALRLSDDPNQHVTIITRAPDPMDSNTGWSQGGIVTRGLDDSAALLVGDILRAGAGLSSPEAARILAEEGPQLVEEILIGRCGVRFDRGEDHELVYGLEAAHSTRRIVHVGDNTGEAIITQLLAALADRPNVTLLTDHTAVDLITFPHHSLDPLDVYEPLTCHGAYVLDRERREIVRVLAAHTILATGGLGQIYRNTSNPKGARGDGIAMAWRAGARIVNAEYVQFHPTTLSARGAPNLLISEAVRGEGAVLLDPQGKPFMHRYAPEWKDLAPRDVVARAIHIEMLEHGYEHVYLDIASKREAAFIRERFPQLIETCAPYGIDPTTEPIPVVPAAHYFCGGVLVDHRGRTELAGLYAVGEVSCSGVHGANRLASTSLLEGLVWGDRAARDILTKPRDPIAFARVPEWIYLGVSDPDPALIEGDMTTIRNVMWHYVGLIRTEERLARADRELRHLLHEIESFYRQARLNDALIGLRNAIQVARTVTFAAQRNRFSRGAHYRADDPSQNDPAQQAVVQDVLMRR